MALRADPIATGAAARVAAKVGVGAAGLSSSEFSELKPKLKEGAVSGSFSVGLISTTALLAPHALLVEAVVARPEVEPAMTFPGAGAPPVRPCWPPPPPFFGDLVGTAAGVAVVRTAAAVPAAVATTAAVVALAAEVEGLGSSVVAGGVAVEFTVKARLDEADPSSFKITSAIYGPAKSKIKGEGKEETKENKFAQHLKSESQDHTFNFYIFPGKVSNELLTMHACISVINTERSG